MNLATAPIISGIKGVYGYLKKQVVNTAALAADVVAKRDNDTLRQSVMELFSGAAGAKSGVIESLGRVLNDVGEAGDDLQAVLGNSGFDWFYSPGTTLWKLLNEMALYHNDYIVTTLPYNDDISGWQRETLYVGPRTGFYKYTERFDDADVLKTIFDKNKIEKGLPIDFVKKSISEQSRITLDKFVWDRGFERGKEIHTGGLFTVTMSGPPNSLFRANEEEIGEVVRTSYTIGTESHPKWGHYVLIRTRGNDNIAGQLKLSTTRGARGGASGRASRNRATTIEPDLQRNRDISALRRTTNKFDSYVLIYNLSDPNITSGNAIFTGGIEASTNVLINQRIRLGDVVGISRSGKNTKQIFFVVDKEETLRIEGDNWNSFNMIEAIRKRNFEDAGGTTKAVFPLDPVALEASRYMININNPSHLLDKQNNIISGYTPVQQYHWIDSRHDIIENMITASAEEIHNKVTILFPGEPGNRADTEFTVVADDNIRAGHIRHLVSEQQNVDPAAFEDTIALNKQKLVSSLTGKLAGATLLPTKYTVAANVLGKEMRPMYRGAIKIWGRPSIRPYDIVYMNDQVNQMYGPFEVAEVIHSYDSENGFTTTLIPHAIVSIRDQSRIYQQVAMSGLTIPYFDKSLSDIVFGVIDDVKEVILDLTDDTIKTLIVAGLLPATALALRETATGARQLAQFLSKRFLLGEVSTNMGQTASSLQNKFLGKAKDTVRGKKKLSKPLGHLFGRLRGLTNAARGSKAVAATRALAAGGGGLVGGSAVGIAAILGIMAVNNVWNKGLAKVMGRDIINVSGLFYNGQPFLAGLEGSYKDSYTVHFMDWVTDMFTFGEQQNSWSHGAPPQE